MPSSSVQSSFWRVLFPLVFLLLAVHGRTVPRQHGDDESECQGHIGEVHRSLNGDPKDSNTKRILCYGDSLTSGFPRGCPYAMYLQEALDAKPDGQTYQVDHIGIIGRRSGFFVEIAGQEHGLEHELKRQKSYPAADVVIIMVGTNNVPKEFDDVAPDTINTIIYEGARSIANDVEELHKIALDSGAAHTIALAIPPSEVQNLEPHSAEMAQEANKNVKQYASGNDKIRFVPFPIEYEYHGVNWSDKYHMTCEGYEALGQALAPIVLSILK